jgi:hypothetical protein
MLDLRQAAVEGVAGHVNPDGPSGPPNRDSGKRTHWLVAKVAAVQAQFAAETPLPLSL